MGQYGSSNWNSTQMNGDGWVRGVSGELFFWVPPPNRRGLYRPRTVHVFGAHRTRVDIRDAALGRRWQECYTRQSVLSSHIG